MVVHHDDPLAHHRHHHHHKNVHKKGSFFVAWYTYNSEAMKDITIKHTDFIHGPSVGNKF